MSEQIVRGFAVAMDRAYDPDTHFWAMRDESGNVRIGMDSLGVEISGTLAQLALGKVGTAVERGTSFGTLEAEKFVGPLVTPLSGVVMAINDAVMKDPGVVERDPYGEGWLMEIAPSRDEEFHRLLSDAAAIVAKFEEKVREYRIEGVLAE